MSGPRSYQPKELEAFLRLLDRELTSPVTITVIGGAAIGLVYDTRHATTDIDLIPIGLESFWEAVARAQQTSPVPLQTVSWRRWCSGTTTPAPRSPGRWPTSPSTSSPWWSGSLERLRRSESG